MPCNPHLPWPLRAYAYILVSSCLLLAVSLTVSQAQVPTTITPDGTLGTVVTRDGTVFGITGGTRPEHGPNLFHSFGQFNVGTGTTAHFVGQQGIDNIIGRVTGGSESLIDGRLQSDATLFLLNPSGFMFGPNATLDINGSFHASTADVLHFADGAEFSARLNAKSTLTVAAPAAFGFLSIDPAGITIERSNLEVHEGETLSIVGGNIEMTGGILKAPSGQVTIASVASSGEAILKNAESSADIDVEDFDRLGDIRITQDGLIDTDGLNGGRVILRSGHVMIDNSSIQAGMTRDIGGNEVGIDIEISEDMLLTNGGVIRTVAQGDQDAADIRVAAGHLHMEGFSFIVSRTSSTGRAGNVAVDAANVTVLEGSQINSLTFGPGDGGTVSVRATDTVTLSGVSENGSFSSGVFANSQGTEAGAGAAGSVEVEAANVTLTDGAAIGSSAFGPGPGGRIKIEATDTVALGGATTLLNASGPSGGTIRIRSGRLLIDGASVFADTIGDAHGPEIGIDVQVDEEVVLTNGAWVTADGTGNGNAGSIRVTADRLELSEGSLLRSRPAEGSAGGAGSIMIAASDVEVAGEGTRIDAGTRGSGPAGSIRIEADRLTITEAAQISTTTRGLGPGGMLKVTARESIDILDESGGQFRSGLFSNSGEGEGGELTGAAGNIEIHASRLTVDGGRVLSRTLGDGNAGNITVEVDRLELLRGGQIFNGIGNAQRNGEILGNPNGTGHGGNLTVRATESVVITGEDSAGFSSGLFSSAQIGTGRGGDVFVTAPRVEIRNGGSIEARTFGPGHGGTITIMASDMLHVAGEGTRIDAGTRGEGSAGSIQLEVNRLMLTEVAQISTTTRGLGPGGALTVIAHESIDIIDVGSGEFRSGLFSNSGEGEGGELTGAAGNIEIHAPRLTVDGGRVLSRTLGDGNAGNIKVEVDRLELLRGGQIFNGIGNAQRNGEILGNPNGTGHGGNLTVRATESVVITGEDSAGFSSGLFSSAQIGRGNAGNISVATPLLTLDAGGQIAAETFGSSQGNAGNIEVSTGQVSLHDGAQVASSTFGSGLGGTVEIVATESISIAGDDTEGGRSGIFSSASASGKGGDIQLSARQIQLEEGASIFAGSSGVGSAGTIRITGADTLLLSGNSSVTTEASQASGGNIEITAQTLVRLQDSIITATVSGGPETVGGNITIDPEFVILENSQIISNANQGRGGNILIEAGVFLAEPNSLVSAIALNSEVGIDGEVNVEAVATNLSDVVTPLPPDFASAAALLQDPCRAQLQAGTVSSLVARERASVPATPEGILPSRLYNPSHTSATPPKAERQSRETAVSALISGLLPADMPMALKCEWRKP